MVETNILEELNLDKWIYAGYTTTYKDGYTWPQQEKLQLGPGASPEVSKCFRGKPAIYKEPAAGPCSFWCACLKKRPQTAVKEVDERLAQVDKDYLKGVKSVYKEHYCSGTPVIEQPYCTVIPKVEDIKISRIKLTEQEERVIMKNYLYRQKIKILRKRPPALEV